MCNCALFSLGYPQPIELVPISVAWSELTNIYADVPLNAFSDGVFEIFTSVCFCFSILCAWFSLISLTIFIVNCLYLLPLPKQRWLHVILFPLKFLQAFFYFVYTVFFVFLPALVGWNKIIQQQCFCLQACIFQLFCITL